MCTQDYDLPLFSELTEAVAPLVASKPFALGILHLDATNRWCHHPTAPAVQLDQMADAIAELSFGQLLSAGDQTAQVRTIGFGAGWRRILVGLWTSALRHPDPTRRNCSSFELIDAESVTRHVCLVHDYHRTLPIPHIWPVQGAVEREPAMADLKQCVTDFLLTIPRDHLENARTDRSERSWGWGQLLPLTLLAGGAVAAFCRRLRWFKWPENSRRKLSCAVCGGCVIASAVQHGATGTAAAAVCIGIAVLASQMRHVAALVLVWGMQCVPFVLTSTAMA